MIEELSDRIWGHPEFHAQRAGLGGMWLQRELGIDPTLSVSDADLLRCVQAATVLALSESHERQGAAYGIAACAAGLDREDLPGLAGVLRIVLSRLGNFPALGSAPHVETFRRLPLLTALAEEVRREGNRVSLGDVSVDLTDFQRHLWRELDGGANVSVSAPTSAGKSFVLQAYLRSLARSGKLSVACYIVPSRALIAQVTDAVAAWRRSDELRDFRIVNTPLPAETRLPERAIYVLTQERLQAIMGSHPGFVADVVISDEAQGIEDGSRGVLLQDVVDQLIAKRPGAQFIFAGPNIRDPEVFGRIFDLSDLRPVSTRSPAVLQNLIVVKTRSPRQKLVIERMAADGRQELGQVEVGMPLPSIKERLVRVAERFGQSKPSIVYANGPKEAEDIALGLMEVSTADASESPRIAELIALIKAAVHDQYDLVRCLEKQVGFHYGRIPAIVRRGVEAAFADGDIKYLVTTSTLIQGVNFPAANLFACKPKKGNAGPLGTAEFWNLAGRAGRLGREFQGNVFLIDYDDWETKPADEGNEVDVQSALKRTLGSKLDDVVECAVAAVPKLERPEVVDIEATFGRLLADLGSGRLNATLDRCGVAQDDRGRLVEALERARERITLPREVLAKSPTVSPLRQQRLADYFEAEIKGGGIARLEELLPRHPRDEDAWKYLSEVFRVCHEQLMSLDVPRLHLRMAAIALKWMQGKQLPDIIEEYRRRSPDVKLRPAIRNTLKDIEEEIRFRYFRLSLCYLAVLEHVLVRTGHEDYIRSLPPLPGFLEVGASDPTMISFVGLGISRFVASFLTEQTLDKRMDEPTALAWLRAQDLDAMLGSGLMRLDVQRALANAPIP
ncbi:Helicase conserved C-terminal domain-containing protein [Methylobacterium sp. 275MFSha3.1]|uniref:DEAD/DEAH box helicase n=1 Tax=Methylobacterium sp. 275MFSha3.1 TaxID=1502746 RepID=UPI0008A755BD|nr:DEAD/DEAH box helicase [Methylobacterium sp. 275MFSha3.1]SEH25735.1 Helicase conserved C-terminal domain-containing protein [Methylobacterium sp. 275MFSha3.1]